MKYVLSVENSAGCEQPVAQEDLANFARALEWASALLAVRGDNADHFLRSTDGSVTVRYVKTAGGQWYAIALRASAGRPVSEAAKAHQSGAGEIPRRPVIGLSE
jgi:hypothetical protein